MAKARGGISSAIALLIRYVNWIGERLFALSLIYHLGNIKTPS